ncbi:MAG: DUF4440 domain-containing protein [Bacteroidota bacterium]
MKNFLLALLPFLLISCHSEKDNPATNGSTFTEEDRQQIEQQAKDLPLILSNEGWEAYEKHFSKDYQNWSMAGDQVRSREAFLGRVKQWYEAGNRATGSQIKTIDFIPITDDMVMYLHAQTEEFNDPQDSTVVRSRDIRFVSIYKKEAGNWKIFFTGFMDKPK